MKSFFYGFKSSIISIFSGWNLLWHLLAIVSTYLIVVSGFDWNYFQYFNGSKIIPIAFTTAPVGGLVPILVPLTFIILGLIKKRAFASNTGYALAQAAILGSFISSLYKAFTGRAHPDLFHGVVDDITHVFQFGFLKGGIFWGWPSSHTTIAFAMAFTLWALFPKNKLVQFLALGYALYIGLGVSVTIHWFSDFVAGAIIGTVIGITVGKKFYTRLQKISSK
jgi:membrane-associated phospholipid phosphatase